MSWSTAFEVVSAAAATCRGCGACVPRCEVLACAGGADVPLSVGEAATAFADAAAGRGDEAARAAVAALAVERPELALAARRCCMDGFCTLGCPDGIDARAVFAALRELLHEAGITGEDGFTMTRVDQQWHIFSAYRAVYGIYYNDLPLLENAREWGADTLFFPGCSLVSYAPELTREVFAWLQGQGMAVALSVDCCGSPLHSGGFADRCEAYKLALLERAREAGIRRVVFVCPGCRDEWETTMGAEAFELIALPELLAEAGVRPRPEKVAALTDRATGNGVSDESDAQQTPALALFDSCHDRDGRFGAPLRRIFSDSRTVELAHHGKSALCCGAAGAVSLVDQPLCDRRAHRALDEEPRAVGADLVVANCPTCAYTFAATRRADAAARASVEGGSTTEGADAGGAVEGLAFCQYLELLFEAGFDWSAVFGQLESMWSGEYGPWLAQELL